MVGLQHRQAFAVLGVVDRLASEVQQVLEYESLSKGEILRPSHGELGNKEVHKCCAHNRYRVTSKGDLKLTLIRVKPSEG